MARIMGLEPEYQEAAQQLLQELLGQAGPTPEPQRIARIMWTLLRRAEADGEEWAFHVVEAAGPNAPTEFVTATLNEDRGTVRVFQNRQAEVPIRYGVRPRHPQTGEYTGGYQMPLWWDMSWQSFFEFVDGLTSQRDRLPHCLAAFAEIAGLRERFPETLRPGEACTLAGI